MLRMPRPQLWAWGVGSLTVAQLEMAHRQAPVLAPCGGCCQDCQEDTGYSLARPEGHGGLSRWGTARDFSQAREVSAMLAEDAQV